MSDKCECQFCKDYAQFNLVLPLLPEVHRAWFEGIFESLWNVQEEYSYKRAILEGAWPDSVEMLEKYLHRAKEVRKTKLMVDSQTVN